MSIEATGAVAPEPTIAMDVDDHRTDPAKPIGLHSPPDSNNAMTLDGSDSELSDVEDAVADQLEQEAEAAQDALHDVPEAEDEDIGEVLPDHWSGTVPVFKPDMRQFKDFKRFMEKVDSYGMKSGIIKVIPPDEWRNSLPPLDDLVKQVRVREPIKQDIMGHNGTYRQVNILHQRSYNLPQWRQLCDQSEHQPPARRGERRANAEKPKPATRSRTATGTNTPRSSSTPRRSRRGRPPRKSTLGAAAIATEVKQEEPEEATEPEERPMTPVSPHPEKEQEQEAAKEEVVTSIEADPDVEEEDACDDEEPVVRRMGFSRQSKPKIQSTSARRKYIRREGSAMIDEAAFKDWDYHMDISDYTPERCEELERIYWKTLTYAPPLYGADLPGTLFDENVENWNLNKLPNLLDVLGTKVPGVNTAYLYLGMWKATFAWHLEDVDLYSINYLHFGAPKQWYSISQADARRFEAAMKSIWPQEAKACDQFLRHKAFLISPAYLKQHFNITVNKCVSYPGEFVVTYPYGYHSGYNLGYNCAEAVNFALDSWLPMGKIAKRCECAEAQDSVWVDVYEIERRLRGESTDYEESEEEDEDEDDEDNDTGLPSPASSLIKVKGLSRKRKRPVGEKGGRIKTKKIRLRIKAQVEPPCCLCPNDIPGVQILPTDDGRKAHRMCALYVPETYIETVDDQEIVANVAGIDKARLDLKCLYCRSRKGACFQCSQKKCARSYHATCAAAAGVFVEDEEVPVIGEDGVEYKEQAFEFSCRFHRIKRDRKLDGETLAENARVRVAAASLKKGSICQMQFYRGDIFAGVVVQNRTDEETLLLDIIPNGDRVEVEWKWLLLPDPSEFRLPKASPNAIPMPTTRKAQQELNAKRPIDDVPRKDDTFVDGYTWAEFHPGDKFANPEQVKVDFSKENQTWYYLGKPSTEYKAQYTEDPSKPQHNSKSNFLDLVPKAKPIARPPPQPRKVSMSAMLPPQGVFPTPAIMASPGQQLKKPLDKPYVYKPRKPVLPNHALQFTSQKFASLPQAPSGMAPGLPSAPQVGFNQPLLTGHTGQSHVQAQFQLNPRPNLPPPDNQLSLHAQQQAWLERHRAKSQQQQQQSKSRAKPRAQLPFGTDPKFKGFVGMYTSDQFAPVGGSNGFPQLPGLTWPPAHMTPGPYSQQRSGDWSASPLSGAPGPNKTPMNSSAFQNSGLVNPQAGAAVPQPPNGVRHKFSFFQVNRNRDPSSYRTPYAPWRGFTNGYSGNLNAFLRKAQQALGDGHKGQNRHNTAPLPRPFNTHASTSPSPISNATHQAPMLQIFTPVSTASAATQPPTKPSFLHSNPYSSSPPATGGTCEIRQPASAPLHRAIRPQFGNSWQQDYASLRKPPSQTSPSTARAPTQPTPAIPKISSFTKQSTSPIPLPPYAKMVTPKTSNTGSPLARTPQISPVSPQGPSPVSTSSGNGPTPFAHAPTPIAQPQYYPNVTTSGLPPPIYTQTMAPPPLPAPHNHMMSSAPFNPPLYSPQLPPLNWSAPGTGTFNPSPQSSAFSVVDFEPAPGDVSFVEQMMANLRRAAEQGSPSN